MIFFLGIDLSKIVLASGQMLEEEIIEMFDSKEQAENSSFYHTKTLYSYIGPDWDSYFDFEKITTGKVIIHNKLRDSPVREKERLLSSIKLTLNHEILYLLSIFQRFEPP